MRVLLNAVKVVPPRPEQVLTMITEVSAGYDGLHCGFGELSHAELGCVVGILGPVLEIETDEDRITSELLADIGEFFKALETEEIAKGLKVGDVDEVVSQCSLTCFWSCGSLAGANQVRHLESTVKVGLRL